MVKVEDVKNILYLDGDGDDAMIQGYIDAADQFVKGAVGDGETFWGDDTVVPLYDMAVKSLAATWYQYRLALSDTQTYAIDMTVNSVIGQLRGLYDVKVGDADATSNKPTQSSN